MKVLTLRDVIKDVPLRWEYQYAGALDGYNSGSTKTRRQILEELQSLDLSACSCEDIKRVIGNDSWTNLRCDECEGIVETVVVCGHFHRGNAFYLCEACLNKALSLLEGV